MIEQSPKQTVQSVTEYVIIFALLAVAGIAIYGLFGHPVRGALVDSIDEEAIQNSNNSVVELPSATPDAGRDVAKFSDHAEP